VTHGTVRFHIKDGKHIDAKVGDYIVVPPRAPHTFSNPTNTEAKFFNTFTPAQYINYFKMLAEWVEQGVKVDAEHVKRAMAYFATIGIEGPF
jgi:cupin superfamily acireductone dioxygenase involved in methionine salvage